MLKGNLVYMLCNLDFGWLHIYCFDCFLQSKNILVQSICLAKGMLSILYYLYLIITYTLKEVSNKVYLDVYSYLNLKICIKLKRWYQIGGNMGYCLLICRSIYYHNFLVLNAKIQINTGTYYIPLYFIVDSLLQRIFKSLHILGHPHQPAI